MTTGDDPYPGTPKVYWAGNTPAGKAALVVQPTTSIDPRTDANALTRSAAPSSARATAAGWKSTAGSAPACAGSTGPIS